MNLGSWIVLVVLVVFVGLIVRGIIKDVRSGKDPLCGQCGHSKKDGTCASCSASAVMLKNIKANWEAADAAKKEEDSARVHDDA